MREARETKRDEGEERERGKIVGKGHGEKENKRDRKEKRVRRVREKKIERRE